MSGEAMLGLDAACAFRKDDKVLVISNGIFVRALKIWWKYMELKLLCMKIQRKEIDLAKLEEFLKRKSRL